MNDANSSLSMSVLKAMKWTGGGQVYAIGSHSLRTTLTLALLASSTGAAGYSGADLYSDCSVLAADEKVSVQDDPLRVAAATLNITACGSFIQGFMQAIAFAEQVGRTHYLCTNGASPQALAESFVNSAKENKPGPASDPGPVFFNAIRAAYPCGTNKENSP